MISAIAFVFSVLDKYTINVLLERIDESCLTSKAFLSGEEQDEMNRTKASIRCIIKHVFSFLSIVIVCHIANMILVLRLVLIAVFILKIIVRDFTMVIVSND